MAESKSWAEWFPTVVGVAVGLLFAFSVRKAIVTPAAETEQLTIIAYLIPRDDSLELRGRVLKEGDPVEKARVWTILSDARGYRDSPAAGQTDGSGGFSISPIPKSLGGDPITEVAIYARKDAQPFSWWQELLWQGTKTLKGEEHLSVRGGAFRRIPLSGWTLLPLPIIFVISIILPFVGNPTRLKYLASILLAFSFSGAMIVYLSLGLRWVNTVGKPGEVLSLGFASIYHGAYAKDVSPEWLFSLTSPAVPQTATTSEQLPVGLSSQPTTGAGAQPKAPPSSVPFAQTASAAETRPKAEPSPVRGFGAPLWVLLVSVLGTAALTVALVVGEIGDQPVKEDEIPARAGAIVRHQFFMFFAPLGAVFVYQLLVVSEAIAQPVTVAIASLGAGAAMSGLLSKALAYATQVIEGFQQEEDSKGNK